MTNAGLPALWEKIDAFFARVSGRYPGELACAPGCHDCCKRRLSVTEVEADAIRRALAEKDEGSRVALAERARVPGDGCCALEPDGRCAIYAARPVVCRSHGLAIRFAERAGPGKRSLPVLDACSKNFTSRELATIDESSILDQTTLSTMLAAIDAVYTNAAGKPRGGRLDLADVVASATAPATAPSS